MAADGTAPVTVAAKSAVAVRVGAPASPPPTGGTVAATFTATATTVWGQNVYVVGNIPALGSWNTANAIPMSPASHPVWSATVTLPGSTGVEYTYIKKNPDGSVTWESGANRTFTTGFGGSVTRSDTWR
ncbi:hypothetical protein GCM10009530_69970 [Microbispora corallina]|uniref:alpha-amylase n=1 Tax=Microbispora corallina TaxID=83302 RepID=A0ABQ4G3A1_9ACTN|nr:carbohydrate-binding module family 20 domain-containing protein [Microbispora corallina]GIH41548.1 hypothetical protein Mco01_45480 [Microbispora corallina]